MARSQTEADTLLSLARAAMADQHRDRTKHGWPRRLPWWVPGGRKRVLVKTEAQREKLVAQRQMLMLRRAAAHFCFDAAQVEPSTVLPPLSQTGLNRTGEGR